MNSGTVPIIGDLLEAGADDRVFDSLLFVGPLLLIFIAVVGRSLLATTLAITYLAIFVTYLLYRGLRD